MAMPNYNRYFVIRTKCRADGDVDFEQKAAYSEASARNIYYTYKAAACVDATYPMVGLSLCDHTMRVLEHCAVTTQWVDPNPETVTDGTSVTE